jgi:hypothetical protein
MTRCLALLLLLPALLAACSERSAREVPPEVRAERRAAERSACVAGALADDAASTLATLDAAAARGAESPALDAIHAATRAYAEAYLRHAQLRESAYAYADSAVNFAKTTADSTRYEEHSKSFVISAPERGSVEGNVFAEYQAKFSAALADPGNPCNWEDQP